MKNHWIAAACFALTACATTPQATVPDLTQAQPTTDVATAAVTEAEAATAIANVREVSMASFADLATCRRYVATGTRIAGERCESNVQTAADRIEYEQTRQDVDSMRQQQMYQEQARQQALADALRRRSGP